MKTYQFKPLILSLTMVWILGIVAPLYAGPNGPDESDLNCEYTFVEDIMDCLQSVKPMDNILIYDQHEQLVISGSENDVIIKNYISRSDLLTEVDNVQYYRLSYDQGNNTDYRLASK